MDIFEANSKLEKCYNDLEYWNSEKEIKFQRTQPKATDTSKELVSGGKRSNILEDYAINTEQIDKEINQLNIKISNLIKYITKELNRIGKYEPITKEIIELRDIQHLSWNQIHLRIKLSESYCRKLYTNFKKSEKNKN